MKFKERLVGLRNEKNWNQAILSAKLNYGASAISNYEKGKNQPSFSDLIKIANIFEVSIDYLLGLSDIRNPYSSYTQTEEIEKLLYIFSDLDSFNKKHLILHAEGILSMQKSPLVEDSYEEISTFKSKPLKVAQKPIEFE